MNKKMKIAHFLIFCRTLLTGFIGGLIWSTLAVMMYHFNFAEVDPKKFILRAWKDVDWTNGWLGDLVSILVLSILSIIVALIYYFLFKKIFSIWMGVFYGITLWMIIFFLIQPLFPNTKQILELNVDTIISTICLFILYGTFVGYSISYDYHDTYVLEKKKYQNEN